MADDFLVSYNFALSRLLSISSSIFSESLKLKSKMFANYSSTTSADFAVTLIVFVSRCRSSVALETQFYSWRHTPSSSRWRHVCVIVHDMPGNTPVRLMRNFRDYYNYYYRGVFPHVLRFRLFIFLHFIFFFLIPRHRFSFFLRPNPRSGQKAKNGFFLFSFSTKFRVLETFFRRGSRVLRRVFS